VEGYALSTIDTARTRIREWRANPCKFVFENFRVEPDTWQVEALEAFASDDPAKQRISLQACAGPGKSAVLAWVGWNFISCYGDHVEHPKGAAVSVTQDNLRDNLWAEFAKWQGVSPWLKQAFEWNRDRIYARDYPETWFISARSWSKKANPDEQARTLSGLHSKYVLALIDESGDIPPAVGRAAEQALSTGPIFGKIVQAGNPTSLEGMLYSAATKLRHLTHVITITGDPDSPRRSSRISAEWAREQIKIHGRDNPWVMSYILGQFPPASINALLGVEDVEAAMRRHLNEDAYSWSQKRLGIDAARFGDDPWIIFPRQGLAAFKPVMLRNPRTQDVVARVLLAKNRWKSEREFFDDTGGYSAGAIDGLIVAGCSPTPINFSSKATDPRFFNKRSEILFNAAEWVKRGGALPNVPDLVAEMTAATYTFQGGKFRVEEKETIKLKIGRSPNYFDALALTFSEPDMVSETDSLLAKLGIDDKRHAQTEFDPFRDVDQQRAEKAAMEFDPYRNGDSL
jgi:phage terminase large subunit